MEKADAEKLAESSRIVIGKSKFPEEKKEVLKSMTMFDKVGVGTDWIELKRQKDEAVAQARQEKAIDTAKKALAKGLSPEDVAEFTDLSISEVMALAGN